MLISCQFVSEFWEAFLDWYKSHVSIGLENYQPAIDKVMNTKIKQYSTLSKMFILLLSVFGDHYVKTNVKTCNFFN